MLEIRNEARFTAVAAGALWALALLAPAGALAAPAIGVPFECTPSALAPLSGITCTSSPTYVDTANPSPNPVIRVTENPTFVGSDPRGLSGVLTDIPGTDHSICRIVSNAAAAPAISDFHITAVADNAACQKVGAPAGTACDPTISGDCDLPCIICEAEQTGKPFGTDPVTGLTCPGDTGVFFPRG